MTIMAEDKLNIRYAKRTLFFFFKKSVFNSPVNNSTDSPPEQDKTCYSKQHFKLVR